MEEIENCPFCDETASSAYIDDAEAWMIFCNNCGASSGYCNEESEAVTAWNTRAEDK